MAPRRSGDEELIDREPQNLLLPMGGFAPVRQRRRPPRLIKYWRRNLAASITAAGLIMALVGVVVTLTQSPVAAYTLAGAIHVGGLTLRHPADNGGLSATTELYTGGASMVLVLVAGQPVKAAAVTQLRGQRVDGVCTMPAPSPTQLVERCTFDIGGKHLTADDHLDFKDAGIWHRHYSDGKDVGIGVPAEGGAVPVPFAIGE